MDVFRVFGSLNYIKNLKLSVDASDSTGGFIEGTLSYTMELLDPNKCKYDFEYYLKLTRDLSGMGFQYLAFKYIMGLLAPCSATMLVLELR